MSKLCDSCFMAAQEEGATGIEDEAMMEMGLDVADHLCDAREDPDSDITCLCACNATA